MWWLPLLTIVAGWAVASAALRPRGSPAFGAVIGLATNLVTGIGLVIAAAMQVGATLNLIYANLVVIWANFLIGWRGLFGARWDQAAPSRQVAEIQRDCQGPVEGA